MPPKPRIGEYKHRAHSRPDPRAPGREKPSRVRRRFPYMGALVLGFAATGPLLAAGISYVLSRLHVLPAPTVQTVLPPSPSVNNVLFGAGVPEVAIASVVAGFILWRQLWKLEVPAHCVAKGRAAIWRSLLCTALPLGLFLTVLVSSIGILGLCIRAAPASVPGWIRPFFAIPAVIAAMTVASIQPVVWLTLIVMGTVLALATAGVAASLWLRFPVEPDNR